MPMKLVGRADASARPVIGSVEVFEPNSSMIVYLASPAARRLTGQAISINGGISAA